MSEHDELADRREAEANYLEAKGERNEDRAEEAREKLGQAQRDGLTPEALGEDDPAHRETASSTDRDETPPPEDEEDPARPRA